VRFELYFNVPDTVEQVCIWAQK